MDYEEPLIPIRQDQLDSYKRDIEFKGNLDVNHIRMIYNKLLQSQNHSYRILLDIHASLNNAGIDGLKKPKHY